MKGFKDNRRSAEIFGVFASHNFYITGFTPEEMRTTLEDLGPIYVKIGQIMSSRTDLLPEIYCKELEKLRSNVKPLEIDAVRKVIESETGRSIEDIYSEFKTEPLGSASIAQAHFGILKDGTPVVTKVQRPLIADMMRKDFVLLHKLAAAVHVLSESNDAPDSVDLQSVLIELEKVTEEELDFRIEAENTKQFRENCIQDPNLISCPEIIDSLTSEKMLTMTYIDGYSIGKEDRVNADSYDRNVIGERIIENYMHQVLDVGTFHADPHQGNILISDGIPYWIDFGMVGHVSDESIQAIQEMVFALIRKDPESLTNAILTIGQHPGNIDRERLMNDVESLMNKYMSVKSLSSLNVAGLLSDLTALSGNHKITLPGEYTMLVRGLVTIEGVLESFCPELDLFDYLMKKMLQRAKDNFDIQEKLSSAIEAVAVTGMNASQIPTMTFDALNNLVKGRTKVKLELTGYDAFLVGLKSMLKSIILAIFACVLFSGSCVLCTTGIQPQSNGVPLVSVIGFAVSIALAIHTTRRLIRK